MPGSITEGFDPIGTVETDVIVVGIDVGGTGTRFVAVDPTTYRVLARVTRPTPAFGDRDEVLALLRGQVAHVAQGRRPVAIGTGVGVCLLAGDRPFRRADGTHPEGGHIAVAGVTTPCYCGRRSCWEQAASRQALQRTAAHLVGREPSDPTVIAELADRAGRGDAPALRAFVDFGRALADGLATLLAAAPATSRCIAIP